MSIQRYRKREPIEVEASVVAVDNINEVAAWCDGQVRMEPSLEDPTINTGKALGIKLLTKQRLQFALIGAIVYKDHEDYFHVSEQGPFNFEYEEIKENNG